LADLVRAQAPEMILQGRVATTTDVFSLAVTISVLMARRHRFVQYDYLHVIRAWVHGQRGCRKGGATESSWQDAHPSSLPLRPPQSLLPCPQKSISEFAPSVPQVVQQVLADCVLPDPRQRPSLQALQTVLEAFQADLQACVDAGAEVPEVVTHAPAQGQGRRAV